MFAKLVFIFITWVATAVVAQPPHNSISQTKTGAAHKTYLDLPNIFVQDSRNREYRLLDLLQDHIAVVNFIFTSCTTICPVLSATMQNIEKQLQDQLGKNVILITISVDPTRDTSEKLRVHAEKLGAGPHWHWLTGRPPEVNRLLKAFGIPSGRPEDHPPIMLAGNVNANNWLRWVGIPSPEAIIEAVNVLAKDHLSRK
jgi:protein SCO1